MRNRKAFTSLSFIQNFAKGFTLIELVMVIVVLGIIATMVSSFISFGSRIYVESANRDDLTASGRFAIERLNREIRTALPNSMRVSENNTSTLHCIEFTPIEASAVYIDIPVLPEPVSDTINLVSARDLSAITLNNAAVYPLNTDDVYTSSGKVFPISSVSGTLPDWVLTLSNAVHFSADSPTQRLYFISTPVMYCVNEVDSASGLSELRRYSGYTYDGNDQPNEVGILMAEFLELDFVPFTVTQASQTRNSTVLVQFKFTRNLEDIYFNNEIQVPNVP